MCVIPTGQQQVKLLAQETATKTLAAVLFMAIWMDHWLLVVWQTVEFALDPDPQKVKRFCRVVVAARYKLTFLRGP